MPPPSLDDVLSAQALARLQDLLAERDDVILSLVAADHRLLWATVPGSRTLYGRDPAEVVGVAARELVHPDDVDLLERSLTLALAGETASCRVRAPDATGTLQPVRLVLWPTRDRDHVVVITQPDGNRPSRR